MHSVSGKATLLSLLNDDLRSLPIKIDWDELLAASDYSRVTALLFNKVKNMKAELSIPENIYKKLHNAYQLNAVRNIFVLEELKRLHNVMANEGLSCILLKGICLINTIFRDNIATRQMSDIDMLVKERDMASIDRLLKESGYIVPPADSSYLKNSGHRRRKAAMYFKKLEDKGGPVPVHIHWHMVNASAPFIDLHWSKISMDDIWKNSSKLRPDDETLLVMDPEHMLIALSVHGFNHGFSRIDLIYDIHAYLMVNRDRMDLSRMARLARLWCVDMPLRMGLGLAKEMFGSALPSTILEDLNIKDASIIEKWCKRQALTCNKPHEDVGLLLYYAHANGISGKMRFLAAAFNLRLLPARN